MKLKENWYFIRQDIVSYLISTLLCIALGLIKEFSWHSVIYSVFDCFVFYLPFWYIRINFADTYHSDKWKHCKFWTRIMLCIGVIVLKLLPIEYSLFNGLFVAFGCCLVLYLVALETNEKKSYKRTIKELERYVIELVRKLEHKDIYAMTEDELYQHCRNCGLSEDDCLLAYYVVIERLQGKELYKAINYSERQTKRRRAKVMKIIQEQPKNVTNFLLEDDN